MKKVCISIILMAIMAIPSMSQVKSNPQNDDPNYTDTFVKGQINTTKASGIVLTTGGLLSLAAGTVIHISHLQEGASQKLDDTAQILMPVGTFAAIVGVLLIQSGDRELLDHKYKNINIRSYTSPHSSGLSLTYNF